MKKARSTITGPIPAVILDIPPRILHPNARGNWQAKHRERSGYRKLSGQLVWAFVKEHFNGDPRWDEATVQLHFFFGKPKKGGRNQKHDPDNLIAWAKPAIDALTDGGLISDDRELIYLPPRQTPDHDHPAALEITVWKGKAVWPPING